MWVNRLNNIPILKKNQRCFTGNHQFSFSFSCCIQQYPNSDLRYTGILVPDILSCLFTAIALYEKIKKDEAYDISNLEESLTRSAEFLYRREKNEDGRGLLEFTSKEFPD